MNRHPNSFSALDSLRAGDRAYGYFRFTDQFNSASVLGGSVWLGYSFGDR